MIKTILVTGATGGIGLETAKKLGVLGHHLLLHGRNQAKLDDAVQEIRTVAPDAAVETFAADLSRMPDVDALADGITQRHAHLDVVMNNAGIFKTNDPITPDGLDVRFMVNTFAPYRLTQRLLPLLDATGRVINLSSAAQAPVNISALTGQDRLADMEAYAQSKLALTMWTSHLAKHLADAGPVIVAVNPGSLLGTKMVREGFGVDGKDIGIGADILVRAALSDEFATASGAYFDNDAGRFAAPHPDSSDPQIVQEVMRVIEEVCQ